MKRILMIVVALALPALVALVALAPASSAAPGYEARVEEPAVPLTIVGTQYATGDKITITTRVTNTGTAYWGNDVILAVYVSPNPVVPGTSVYWAWYFEVFPPSETIDLTGPNGGLPLNIGGKYKVVAIVMRDSNHDGEWDPETELISNVATKEFTVTGADDYSASVEIVSIQAAVLAGFGALAGGLAGVRFF